MEKPIIAYVTCDNCKELSVLCTQEAVINGKHYLCNTICDQCGNNGYTVIDSV